MKRCMLLSIITLLLLSGCGNKKLVCEKNDNSNKDLKINEKVKIKLKKDKVTNIKVYNYIKTFGIYKNYKQELKDSVVNKYSGIDNKNIKINSDINKDNINIEIKLDIENMTEESKGNISIINVHSSYKDIKNNLHDKGYECK